MNVLHVVQSFDLSGRSRVIHDLGVGLRSRGIESTVACLAASAGWRPKGLPCVCFGRRQGRDPVLALRLARHVLRCGISVVHTHGKAGLIYGSPAAFLTGRPLVHTVHRADGDLVSSRPWFRRFALGRVRTAVAVSDAARHRFVADNGFPESRIVTIHNGIDVLRFAREGRGSGQGWGCDEDRDKDRDEDLQTPTLGSVANLNGDKDIESLLRAFAGIRAAVPGARLLIAGDGPGRGEIERFAAKEGLDAGVDFLGFTTDIPGFLHGLDLFVLSSRTEGLGIAILEAMAAGVPVVASATGGIPEIVEDRVTGRLFEPGDPSSLRDVIVEVVQDSGTRRRTVRNAGKMVMDRFSVERLCDEYFEVYRSARR